MALLLAVLEPLTLVVLEQPVLPAEMPVAEAAIADDALGGVLALLVAAADLLRWHPAAQRQGHVQGAVGRDGVGGQRRRGRREVLAGVDEAQVRGRGQIGAQGQERAQRLDGRVGGQREGDCWGTRQYGRFRARNWRAEAQEALTGVARDGLDEDVHRLVGVAALAADAGDGGRAAHRGGGTAVWCGVGDDCDGDCDDAGWRRG